MKTASVTTLPDISVIVFSLPLLYCHGFEVSWFYGYMDTHQAVHQ